MTRLLACVVIVVCAATASHAKVVDLTTDFASDTANGVTFTQIDPRATGTGLWDPFVRIQGAAGIEQGYNSDYRPVEFDEDTNAQWNHSIKLSDIPTEGAYKIFLLDINEPGGPVDRFVSLDEIRLYVAAVPNLTGYPGSFPAAVWDLDVGPDGNSLVALNYKLNTGSGSGDMSMAVPTALFGAGDPYVYLYSKFGVTTPHEDGFEEWALGPSEAPPVPEPASCALLAFAIGGIGAALKKRRTS